MIKLFKYLLFICLIIMLSACSSKAKYTLSFNSNGGSDVNSLQTDGKSIVQIPKDPIKEGYNFSGWYLDNETFNIVFTANSLLESKIKSDLTVYAKWTEIQKPVKVVFNPMGGTEVSDVYVLKGSKLEMPISSKKECAFEGWYTSSNGGVTFDEKWSLTSDIVNGDMILYAKWVPNQYKINYTIVSNEFHKNLGIPLYTRETIVQVSAGAYHSSAITSIGRVFMWGSNANNAFGTNSYGIENIPVDITNIFNLSIGETIIQVSLGFQRSSAITSKGRVFMIGYFEEESAISKNAVIDITNSLNLKAGERVIQVSLGLSDHFSVVTSIGRIFTWGTNEYGQVGDGTTQYQSIPIDITNNFYLDLGETIIQVALGHTFSSAITSIGRYFIWGSYNESDGKTVNITTPVDITNRFNLIAGESIVHTSVGVGFSSVITSKGRLFTWGDNTDGQLGDGTTVKKLTPVDITSRFNLSEGETINIISTGAFNVIAMTSSDRIFTWGYNKNSQLGDGATTNQCTPIDITNKIKLNIDESITQISSGSFHSLMITSVGRLIGWGYNGYGQLGDRTTTDISIPSVIEFKFLEYICLKSVHNYNEIIKPYIPELENHTFSGWYSDLLLKKLYIFTTMPAQNITLYGYWIKNE